MEEKNEEILKNNEEENNEPEMEAINSEDSEMSIGTDSNEEEMETMKIQLERLQEEKDNTYERMLRIQAEFDNFKRRTQKEKEAERKYKSQDLINELLPVIDNFERALQVEVPDAADSFVEGITMVYRQFQDALKSQGVAEIEAVGKEFDPNLHHAVMQTDDDELDPNMVAEELQKGYMLKDRVIRPAMVKVNK